MCSVVGCCEEDSREVPCVLIDTASPCLQQMAPEPHACPDPITAGLRRIFQMKCCICELAPRFVDYDTAEGEVAGYLQFGGAKYMTGWGDAESDISGYNIYLVDQNYSRLEGGESLTFVPVTQHSNRGLQCCDPTSYRVHVNVSLPDGPGQGQVMGNAGGNGNGQGQGQGQVPHVYFDVVPVGTTGIDLILGKKTDRIQDLTPPPPGQQSKIRSKATMTVSNPTAYVNNPSVRQAWKKTYADLADVPEEMVAVQLCEGTCANTFRRRLQSGGSVEVVAEIETPAEQRSGGAALADRVGSFTTEGVSWAINQAMETEGVANLFTVVVNELAVETTSTTTTTSSTTTTTATATMTTVTDTTTTVTETTTSITSTDTTKTTTTTIQTTDSDSTTVAPSGPRAATGAAVRFAASSWLTAALAVLAARAAL